MAKNDVIVKRCNNCAHDKTPAALYQNERYGHGMRVHTPTSEKAKTPRPPRCTVCGR